MRETKQLLFFSFSVFKSVLMCVPSLSCRMALVDSLKTPAFFEFSLCLSRAWLGKMITFIYKWLKKPLFFLPQATRRFTRRSVS